MMSLWIVKNVVIYGIFSDIYVTNSNKKGTETCRNSTCSNKNVTYCVKNGTIGWQKWYDRVAEMVQIMAKRVLISLFYF